MYYRTFFTLFEFLFRCCVVSVLPWQRIWVYHPTYHLSTLFFEFFTQIIPCASTYVNGVAELHTEILKADVLKEWYQVYPERFQNKTNGITQRRWLGLCNPELSALITEKVGSDAWLTDLSLLEKLNDCIDTRTITKFNNIKKKKKQQLADYIKKMDGYDVNPDSIYDIVELCDCSCVNAVIELFKKRKVCKPCIWANLLCDKSRKLRVAKTEPTALCDTVCLVLESLGIYLIPLFEYISLEDFCVKLGNTIYICWSAGDDFV